MCHWGGRTAVAGPEGFKESSIRGYRWVWDKFAAYARRRGRRYFSESLARAYVRAVASRRPAPILSALRTTRRAMRVLQEHVVGGSHRQAPLKGKRDPLLPFMEKAFSLFVSHARAEWGWSEKTIRNRGANVRRFLGYLRSKGVRDWGGMTPARVMAHVETLSGRAVNTRVAVMNSIRPFCRLLFAKGILATAVHEGLPPVHQERDGRLLSLWTKEEIRQTLAAVDRRSPTGKRAYAILLLATRLGMRVGDIRKLRLEDIHWEQSFIEFVQEKTKVPLRLPIPDDVGEALADYLRHGRPATARREVFLSHLAPYGPLGRNNNLHSIVTQYRDKAGLPRRPHCGLHSLRHTLATCLLEGGATLQAVGGVLGHRSLDTTSLYVRFGVDGLRQAGLDPDEEVRHV